MPKKHLVIVESPAKAKTIEKFLGSDYHVKSSFGHIRDLPKKGMSVDIEKNFTPNYEVSPEKTKTVNELKKAAAGAQNVWLASDEDREGEAIAWHLAEALKLDPKKTKRIVFHEITKPAVTAAIENPRTIDVALVNAQQARRILDRIVGYELSPVLWKKVRPGLSAGRVQSVAVRLIVEREREIEAFETASQFKLTAVFKLKDGTELHAELPEKLKTADRAKTILEQLDESDHSVASVEMTPGTRNPSPPFTTSTLQQAASSRLGYSPKQTMMLAQRLYEEGKITYMRTDSLNLSNIAVAQMSDYVKGEFGENYLKVRKFTTKTAGAQEAHEAIRPTNIAIKDAGEDPQQKKLYNLIWRRALASQMAAAQVEKTTVTIDSTKCKEHLEAKGEIVLFDGFLKLDPPKKSESDLLPNVEKGDELKLIGAEALESLTKGPARYTEASLVRKLEEMGIGRPSTYAPTISTIQTRGYVIKGDLQGEEKQFIKLTLKNGKISEDTEPTLVGADKNKLLPTDTGNIVTDFLVKHFKEVVDFDFTKDVEEFFDHIADGKLEWQKMLKDFYGPFHKTVEGAADVSRAEAAQARVLGKDPKTGKPISARYGRFGPMVQMGEAEDDEKPDFAGIPSDLSVETITLEQALKLFDLPRVVGQTEDGKEIKANIGRFGPYIQVDKLFVSIKPLDPYKITLKEALELYAAKLKAEKERNIADFGDGIKVLKGRFGPYVTDGKKNAKIPKETDPKKVTHEQAIKMLAEAPEGRRRFTRRNS